MRSDQGDGSPGLFWPEEPSPWFFIPSNSYELPVRLPGLR